MLLMLAMLSGTTMMTASAQAQAPVRTVERVDLQRYLGEWFEIARFPNRFQRTCAGDVRASAKSKVRFAPGFLSFLPFVWGDYWVIGLADDYSWAVVGSPDRAYLWILGRTPVVSADRYESALAAARANGFDVQRLVKTSQAATPGAIYTPDDLEGGT